MRWLIALALALGAAAQSNPFPDRLRRLDEGSGDSPDTPEPDDEGPSAESPVVEPADAEPDSDVPVDDLLDEVSGPAEATEADDDPQTDVVALKSVNQESADELVDSATEAEESVETVNVVSALVSNVVSPFADPEAPAPAPWLDAVLAWVRRQIEHTFFNKSPVFGPIESSQILTGQVLFDLNESDPNGDPLTYTIIQPEHGLVVRELITGKFVYTPTSIVAGDPLTDSFQVVISDSSEHLTGTLGAIQKVLHGIARLFGLAEADEVTVTVPVTVNPIVQLPPVIVTIGAPIYSLGGDPVKVVSSVTITMDCAPGGLGDGAGGEGVGGNGGGEGSAPRTLSPQGCSGRTHPRAAKIAAAIQADPAPAHPTRATARSPAVQRLASTASTPARPATPPPWATATGAHAPASPPTQTSQSPPVLEPPPTPPQTHP